MRITTRATWRAAAVAASTVLAATAGALVPAVSASAASTPPTVVGTTAGTGNATEATAYTLRVPAGVTAGDFLVAAVSTRGSTTLTAPVGWKLVASASRTNVITMRAFSYRCGTQCVPGAALSWQLSKAGGVSGTLAAYRGVDTVTPVDRSAGQSNDWSTYSTSPSVQTTVNGDALLALHATGMSATYTAPSGMTKLSEAVDSAGKYRTSTGASSQELGAAGTTGLRVGRFSTAGTNVGLTIALRPVPAPVGAPAPVTGSVLWKADTNQPFESDWGSLSTTAECAVLTKPGQTSQRIHRVAEATSPSPTGGFYRASVVTGDECYGSRAEMASGNPVKSFTDGTGDRLFRADQDQWISFGSRLAPNYPINSDLWSLIFQWKQTAAYGGPDGYPVLSLTASRGQYRMWGPGYSELNQQNPPTGAYGSWGVDFASAPSTGQWHLFSMHVVWSPDPAKGYVELFGDLKDGLGWRTLITGRNVATMKINDSGGSGEVIPTHARAGIYRDARHTTDTHVDVAGYTVATTRAAAEANAFRQELRSGS